VFSSLLSGSFPLRQKQNSVVKRSNIFFFTKENQNKQKKTRISTNLCQHRMLSLSIFLNICATKKNKIKKMNNPK